MFPRKLESFYTHSRHIAEFWNTLSNLPFVLIGLYRLWHGVNFVDLYILYVLAGVCSAFHHAHPKKWTIVIDWIPILISGYLAWEYDVWYHTSTTSRVWLGFAFGTLINDHVCTSLPVPKGHVLWHILAAYSIDSAYQDLERWCV